MKVKDCVETNRDEYHAEYPPEVKAKLDQMHKDIMDAIVAYQDAKRAFQPGGSRMVH